MEQLAALRRHRRISRQDRASMPRRHLSDRRHRRTYRGLPEILGVPGQRLMSISAPGIASRPSSAPASARAYNHLVRFRRRRIRTAGSGFGRNPSEWHLAWALYAGVGYNVSKNLKVDLTYRYLNLRLDHRHHRLHRRLQRRLLQIQQSVLRTTSCSGCAGPAANCAAAAALRRHAAAAPQQRARTPAASSAGAPAPVNGAPKFGEKSWLRAA